MVWLLMSSFLVGVIIGLRFKVGGVAVASLIVAVTALAIGLYGGLTWIVAVGITLALLAALQVGYLAGLVGSAVRVQREVEPGEEELSARRMFHDVRVLTQHRP